MLDQIVSSILDLISQIVGESLGRESAMRVVATIVVAILLTYISIKWKTWLYKVGHARKLFDSRERYCGYYIQPLSSADVGLRYTILRVFFDTNSEAYRAIGKSYRPDGRFFASFESRYMVFPGKNTMEFVWSGLEEANPMAIGGLTRIKFDNDRKGSTEKGHGYSVDFVEPARTNRLFVEEINKPANEPEFIRELHRFRGAELINQLGAIAN